MKNPLVRTAAACLGLSILPLASAHSGTDCDASWMGTGVSTSPSAKGHVTALRGTDGIVRVNEWQDASKTWGGWFVLPDQPASQWGDPWVQFVSNPGSPFEAQNIYSVGSTSVKQWILTRTGTTWTVAHKYPFSSTSGSAKIQKRVASAQTGPYNSTLAGNQKVFATFSDGVLRYQDWTVTTGGASWTGQWQAFSPAVPSGAGSAPYAVQLTPSTVNLYVRGMDGKIYQSYWDGTKWWPNWIAVNFADYNQVEDPASNFSSASEHVLYTLQVAYQNGPSYFHYQKYTNTWSSWLNSDLDRIVKSLAPVNSPNNTSTLYGIDGGNSAWESVLNNQTTFFSKPNRVNCLNDFDAP